MSKGPGGIYLHWPFCRSKCTFCDFATAPERESVVSRYGQALVAEIEAFDASRSPELAFFDTLYWGGGTPSLMPLPVLEAAMLACRRRLHLLPDCEITLEANPGTIDAEKACTYRQLGINRVSLGFESFQDAELERLNRSHSVREALDTYELLRTAGFGNISGDLICGLPGQSAAGWEDSVRRMVDLGPEHVSVYLLELHPGTRLHQDVQAGREQVPEDEEFASRYYKCIEIFEDAGYEQYEISSFARKGCQSRHNWKYWNDASYVGFGASSHFAFGGKRFRNERNLESYMRRVSATGRGVAEEITLDRDHWLGDYAFTALRTRKGIDLHSFRETYGFSFEDYYDRPIDRMLQLGMLEVAEGCLRLTRPALIVSNEVFQQFV